MKLTLKKNSKKAPGKAAPSSSGGAHSAQGITATGNALRSTTLSALLCVLLALAIGFGYLLFIRAPALQEAQIERMSRSFAIQQASNIHRVFTQLRDRMLSAKQSPLLLSAIASRSPADIAQVEQAMRNYFPEVTSLRVLPIGELGTADFTEGDTGLRNHIEVDLVRKASEGEQTQPEAYQFADGWLTSIAARVTHPRIADRHAVMLITLDNAALATQLAALDDSAGRFALEQRFAGNNGGGRTSVIAASGSADPDAIASHADIPATNWQVAFTPSTALLSQLAVSPLPLVVVLLLTMLAATAAMFFILQRFPRQLEADLARIVAAADRKSPLELAVPELVAIAKQLRRATLRALRHSQSPGATAADSAQPLDGDADTLTADPLFQPTDLLDSGSEILDLDLAEDALPELLPAADSGLPEHIFRAYDIRGNAETELTDELVAKIGRAIGSIAGDMHEQTLIVGCDGRNSSGRIKATLIRALMETGRDVVDIGLVPTPLLYYATRQLDYHSGIMVTGSHNPAEDNGLKIVLGQQTIAAGGIVDIRNRLIAGDFSEGDGRMMREDIVAAYIEEVIEDIAIAVPLKIVLDAGNGVTGNIAPELFEELGCEVIPLYCNVDGNFPNRQPDTSDESNLADLARTVKEQGADLGVAFDGDGDRLAVVTSSGRIVRADVLLMLYAEDVVSRNPGADVVFDVKCSRNLTQLVTRHGGRPVLWKTGHAFMKEKMRETNALLGGEFSGHIFFGERWYGFDDGMYAAARLAEILSTHGESLDDCIDKFPATINTPEIIIPVPDNYKFKLMEKIVNSADFSSGKVNTLDGIRVDFSDGWGLIRASNTVPALTARFEADSSENLAIIKDEFRAQIGLVDPGIELNF